MALPAWESLKQKLELQLEKLLPIFQRA